MKVLITGGAGFIGSHLVEHALAAGHGVRVLDNLSTGKRQNLPPGGAVDFILGDVRDRAAVASATAGMDAVVHLAAVASVQASVDDPVGTHATNFDGTLNLLEAARHAGIRRILYASSAAVYGDNEELPVTEEARPRPLTPYAADKLAGEYYLGFYASRYGISTTAFRFFNIFGPRQDPSSPYSGVISIFASRVASAQPITLYGDGRQTRDFVFVGDLAGLLVRALSLPDLSGQVMNVGRGIQASLLDVLEALERVTGHRLPRIHAEPRLGDIRHSCADVTRLRRLMGEVPATDLTVGLESLMRSIPG